MVRDYIFPLIKFNFRYFKGFMDMDAWNYAYQQVLEIDLERWILENVFERAQSYKSQPIHGRIS